MSVYSISAMEIIGKWCLKALLIVYTIAGITQLFIVKLKLLEVDILKSNLCGKHNIRK